MAKAFKDDVSYPCPSVRAQAGHPCPMDTFLVDCEVNMLGKFLYDLRQC